MIASTATLKTSYTCSHWALAILENFKWFIFGDWLKKLKVGQNFDRVATGQERVKFFSGQEKVRKKQYWSGKLEKITKSQEKIKKNTKFSFKIQ